MYRHAFRSHLQDQLLSPGCIWEACRPSTLKLLLTSSKRDCGSWKSLGAFLATVFPSHVQAWVVC